MCRLQILVHSCQRTERSARLQTLLSILRFDRLSDLRTFKVICSRLQYFLLKRKGFLTLSRWCKVFLFWMDGLGWTDKNYSIFIIWSFSFLFFSSTTTCIFVLLFCCNLQLSHIFFSLSQSWWSWYYCRYDFKFSYLHFMYIILDGYYGIVDSSKKEVSFSLTSHFLHSTVVTFYYDFTCNNLFMEHTTNIYLLT